MKDSKEMTKLKGFLKGFKISIEGTIINQQAFF